MAPARSAQGCFQGGGPAGHQMRQAAPHHRAHGLEPALRDGRVRRHGQHLGLRGEDRLCLLAQGEVRGGRLCGRPIGRRRTRGRPRAAEVGGEAAQRLGLRRGGQRRDPAQGAGLPGPGADDPQQGGGGGGEVRPGVLGEERSGPRGEVAEHLGLILRPGQDDQVVRPDRADPDLIGDVAQMIGDRLGVGDAQNLEAEPAQHRIAGFRRRSCGARPYPQRDEARGLRHQMGRVVAAEEAGLVGLVVPGGQGGARGRGAPPGGLPVRLG
ncbi:hypothetical protein SAMN02799627_04966 [Methylobacterium sp. 13MFTsu3.1M2]|nr:hypothetical protein SAMN02799627_04966 [Methylobacterium sp. 13MFTsu3.1M2]